MTLTPASTRFARRARRPRGAALQSALLVAAGVAFGAAATWFAASRTGAPATPAETASVPLAAASAPPVSTAAPGEAAIRETLAARIPDLPRIDEVTRTPIAGLYEVRIGTDLIYSDERGRYLVQGNLIDTATRSNLTQERVEQLTAVNFSDLPVADAIVFKLGTGARKVAYFADPHCGYCKRFERDIADAKDVTVHIYLLPILGADSMAKSRNVWCSKDRLTVWRDWMLEGKVPPAAAANCDTAAIERNLALGRKHRINGTPALVFEDGRRVPGAMPLEAFERQLASSSRKS